ncbi:hypothetical protein Tco_0038693 [Tanacetum coccineum]
MYRYPSVMPKSGASQSFLFKKRIKAGFFGGCPGLLTASILAVQLKGPFANYYELAKELKCLNLEGDRNKSSIPVLESLSIKAVELLALLHGGITSIWKLYLREAEGKTGRSLGNKW